MALPDLDKNNIEKEMQSEWLETNGLGGWAGSTINGCNTRRYHGLLIAATKPPTERMVLVSKLDETLIINGERFELGVNDYGDVLYPEGYQYVKRFKKDLYPEFTYTVGNVEIKKSILMVHNENTTIIRYEVVKGESLTLELLPLLAGRGYHQLGHQNHSINEEAEVADHFIKLRLYETTPDLFIGFAGADYHPNPNWYFHFNYSVEKYRGLDFTEDLFTPGYISIQLRKGDAFYVMLSTSKTAVDNAQDLFNAEVKRRKALVGKESNETVKQLVLSADQFIVKRNIQLSDASQVSPEGGDLEGATIIAGYHWFTDWGRDTMIALPGLCLSTKRFEDAKKILYAFAQSVDKGMLPNRFQDNGEAPEYNNVDGTLQYFIAIHQYLQATGDKQFVLQELLPVLKDIIDWHYSGTRYNIHVDEEGLLYAGEKGYQLTWMDARIGDWVVTPRMGKPVEIQALWYNALCIFTELLLLNGQEEDANNMLAQAKRVKENFLQAFWFDQGGYLYDVIDEKGNKDASIRPNQLFAISLPYQLIEGKHAKQVMKVVEQKLYTAKGLRSLSPDDERYIPFYGGDQFKRDSSYHQGTVWSWLLGPYIDSIFKTNGSSAALTKGKKVINNFLPHLSEAGIGTISEIFDGNEPHSPRGCVAQAWSVGELLRVIKKYNLVEAEIKASRSKASLIKP
jgi:predicted glycogen debranching enzyme